MVAEVYYAHRRATMGQGLLDKAAQLFTVAGFGKLIEPQAQVAIKVAFPERGNITHVRPQFVRRIVDQVRAAEGRPFLTDALRPGEGKGRGVSLLECVHELGYGTAGAPVVLANGIGGQDQVGGVPSAIQQADVLLVVNHFTGHDRLGFCGCLANLGLASLGQEGGDLAAAAARAFAAAVAGKPERCGYFNFLLEITADTDYGSGSDAPIAPDVGILASRDPVALDQASVDLFNQQAGAGEGRMAHGETGDKLRALFPNAPWRALLEQAEALGLGSREYELMVV